MDEFRRMTDLVSHCRLHPETMLCPLYNAQMDALITPFFGSFDFNHSGLAVFKCRNIDCHVEFKVAALEAVV